MKVFSNERYASQNKANVRQSFVYQDVTTLINQSLFEASDLS